jgi:hypothetical protein
MTQRAAGCNHPVVGYYSVTLIRRGMYDENDIRGSDQGQPRSGLGDIR